MATDGQTAGTGKRILPHLVDKEISMDYKQEGETDGKKGTKRQNYSKEFKTGAAPAEKREKPISQTAGDLGFNGSVLRCRADCRSFPGTNGPGTGIWPGCGKKPRRCGRHRKLRFR
jgi:hypothetical protein